MERENMKDHLGADDRYDPNQPFDDEAPGLFEAVASLVVLLGLLIMLAAATWWHITESAQYPRETGVFKAEIQGGEHGDD